MFDLRKIPISRVLLPFAGGAGVGLGNLHSGSVPELASFQMLIWILLIMFGIAILLVLIYRGKVVFPGFKGFLFSMLCVGLFFISGWVNCMITRRLDPDLPLDKYILIRGEITKGPTAGARSLSYGMQTRMVCSGDTATELKTNLKVHLKVSSFPDSAPHLPRPGETWQMLGRLIPIQNSGNPGAPDYKSILSRQNCWYRFYPIAVSDSDRQGKVLCRRISTGKHLSASGIRRAVSSPWKGTDEEISLLKAVCLGDRSDLSPDTKQAFAHAGAMHLLAVSGLHLGLIWWVLYRLFSWMTRISGKEVYRSVSIIALLWMFAFVSGFSSSVSRAACMFTLFTAGRLMDQRMQSVNAILVSAFLLILIRPQTLLDVGFQLSYAAILGIVSMYQPLTKLLHLKNRILRRVWEASLVSLSAQLATAPFVMYYFHQIPVYSVFTSLITIPLLSLLIGLFVISLPFALTGTGFDIFNVLLVKLAGLMNFLVEGIASLPGAVWGGVHMDLMSLCLWSGILFTGLLRLHHRAPVLKYLIVFLLSVSLCHVALDRYRIKTSSAMQISHFYNASMLSFREGEQVDHFCWYVDSLSFSLIKAYVDQNWSSRRFQSRIYQGYQAEGGKGRVAAFCQVTPGLWLIGNDRCKGWLVSGTGEVNTTGNWDFPAEDLRIPESNFVVLSASPRVWHLPITLLKEAGPVILDASNYDLYFAQIERLRSNKPLDFEVYRTEKEGAYLKRW